MYNLGLCKNVSFFQLDLFDQVGILLKERNGALWQHQSGFNQTFATTTHVSYYWHHHLVVSGPAEHNCLKNCGNKFLLYKKFGKNFQKWFYIPNYLKFSKTELTKSVPISQTNKKRLRIP